jgi:hypothetical protein
MYFYGAVVAANIGYALVLLYIGEQGLATLHGGLAAALIGIRYYG